MNKPTTVEAAVLYNQCLRRRQRVRRALRNIRRLNYHAPAWSDDPMPPYTTEAYRHVQEYEYRLLEVNNQIEQIRSRTDFAKVSGRAAAERVAPYIGGTILIGVALGVLYGVFTIARAVWF